MRLGFLFYRLGAWGIFLTVGVFWNKPVMSDLKQNPSHWPALLILFGFGIVAGLMMLLLPSSWVEQNNRTLLYVSHSLVFLALIWILLWCFLWWAVISSRADHTEMEITNMAYFHLFGVGFAMAGYVLGWRERKWGGRALMFLMTVGWILSYMAWINLYLQPGLLWLWAPALGGLLVTLGAFWVARSLNTEVETPAKLA